MKQRCRYCQTGFDLDLDRCPKCCEETYKDPPIGTFIEEAMHKPYKRGSYFKSKKNKERKIIPDK